MQRLGREEAWGLWLGNRRRLGSCEGWRGGGQSWLDASMTGWAWLLIAGDASEVTRCGAIAAMSEAIRAVHMQRLLSKSNT